MRRRKDDMSAAGGYPPGSLSSYDSHLSSSPGKNKSRPINEASCVRQEKGGGKREMVGSNQERRQRTTTTHYLCTAAASHTQHNKRGSKRLVRVYHTEGFSTSLNHRRHQNEMLLRERERKGEKVSLCCWVEGMRRCCCRGRGKPRMVRMYVGFDLFYPVASQNRIANRSSGRASERQGPLGDVITGGFWTRASRQKGRQQDSSIRPTR